MSLRPYQRELVDSIIAEYHRGTRAVCMQLGTGGGKTHTAATIIEYAVGRGHRVLFLAHLDSLITDTHARLARAGIHAGFVQADRPIDATAPVQVASMQTLHVRGVRPPADFIIIDEAHRVMGASVRAILRAYPAAWLLGLTATPQRGDGRPLGDVFQSLLCGPSNRWLIEHGHLVPCDVLGPTTFNDKALVDDPVAAYCRSTPGKRAIVFAASVAHARQLAAGFTAAGHRAGLLIGSTKRVDRERLREECASGVTPVLVGCGVFLEGFDLPAIEVAILARPFSVTGSYLQAIGRSLRPSPGTGKTNATVLDLRGSVHLHGFVEEDRTWSISGAAVVRTDTITSLRRCTACLAIYRPARHCPRCGAVAVTADRVPRVLRRAEKLERLNDVPQAERDRRAVLGLANRLRRSPKFAGASDDRVMKVAVYLFEKARKRKVAA